MALTSQAHNGATIVHPDDDVDIGVGDVATVLREQGLPASEATARRLIDTGKIPSHRLQLGTKAVRLCRRADVIAFVAQFRDAVAVRAVAIAVKRGVPRAVATAKIAERCR